MHGECYPRKIVRTVGARLFEYHFNFFSEYLVFTFLEKSGWFTPWELEKSEYCSYYQMTLLINKPHQIIVTRKIFGLT
jgi:hypothetical protein